MVVQASRNTLSASNKRSQSRRTRTVHAAVETLELRQLLTVSPTSITLGSGSPIFTGGSDAKPISVSLPSGSVTDKVDIVLVMDDTGSFTSFSATVSSIFSALTTSLEAALPGVDFAFGVTRFEDFGGPGTDFSGDTNTARPFYLNQPVVNATTAGSKAARNALITTALAHTGPGFGGDGPEADIEALHQIATGVGFDGNGNGSTSESGAAGGLNTQTAPGTSGDIPAFSTNTLKTSGTLGGVGWRDGALHLVLLATDIDSVSPFPAGSPIPATITGAGGKTVASSAFAESSATAGAGRFGFVSNSKSHTGNTVTNSIAPAGAGTVQATVTALNALGIRVLGMGPSAAPTTSTAPSSSPSTFLSALGRLTGALDKSGNPLVFSTSTSSTVLTTAIVNAISTTTKLPVDINIKTTTPLPAGVSFSYKTTGEAGTDTTPLVWEKVAPGATGSFTATFTGSGTVAAGKFDIDFVDKASGAILGVIPVTVTPATSGTSVTVTSTASIKENDTETLKGTISDSTTGAHTVNIDWADGSTATTLSLPSGTLTFTTSHKYLDDGTSPGNLTPSDNYAIKIDVTNSAAKTFSTTANITVNNVAPTVKLSGPTTATAGDSLTYTGSFTDPGTLDHWTGLADFGDGGPGDPVTINPDKTFTFTHTFDTDGTFPVKVIINDDDTGSGTATVNLVVGTSPGGGVSVGPDPCGDGVALFVNGTDLNEHIRVAIVGGKYRVTDDNPPFSQDFDGPFAHVIIDGKGGNDFIESEEEVTTSVWMFGGTGNDTIQHEGGGFGILIGGDDNDSLHGGASEKSAGLNRDVLIGGKGADVLDGDRGEDILITGTTDSDNDLSALCKIEDVWKTTDPFNTRVANMASLLNASTVHADGESNLMYGNKDKDWYFCNRSGIGNAGKKDKINFIEAGEKITNILM